MKSLKSIKKIFGISQNKNQKVLRDEVLIISANSDQNQSVICQNFQWVLQNSKKNYQAKYHWLNLYSYKIPTYKIGSKTPPELLKLINNLNKYSNYILIFPIWYSTTPAILKNFIDWSGGWGTKKNKNGKYVGILTDKKIATISSCWNENKNYLKKLENTINFQLQESWLDTFGMTYLKTIIISGAHSNNTKTNKIIRHEIEKLIDMFNLKND